MYTNFTIIRVPWRAYAKLLLIMKLTTIILMLSLLQVSAASYGQNLTMQQKNVKISRIFLEIRKQTGYDVILPYSKFTETRFNADFKDTPVEQVMDELLSGKDYNYSIKDKTIVINAKEPSFLAGILGHVVNVDVHGIVTDMENLPLAGATVKVKGNGQSVTTSPSGDFTINVPEKATLQITYVGYVTKEISVARELGVIKLELFNSKLDEVQVIAYGTTTKRLNTGSVSSITSDEISKQPVSNVLATLSGRIPGLEVTQSSGVPGSSFNLQIRGRSSIAQGSQPLILIDGIPFSSGNEQVNQMPSAIGNGITGSGLSPFATINPADIESIDVLKDADATAIYGSRGANGVILISTRKGKAGKTSITANFNQGITQVGKTMEMMNSSQYLEMRREGFKNSGITPDASNAPDLTVWDNNRYTNLKDELIGNKGHFTNAQVSLSGGTSALQFLMSGAYYRETNVFPGKLANDRGNFKISLNHTSLDNLFTVSFTGGYSATQNNTAAADLTYYTYLSPNTPSFFDENGNLKWQEGGAYYENPYQYLFSKYRVNMNNTDGSMNIGYRLLPSLSIRAALGYNLQNIKEFNAFPKNAKSPQFSPVSSASFGDTENKGWNVEPQIEYSEMLWLGKLNILAGATFYDRKNNSSFIDVGGFSSDALLESLQASTIVNSKSSGKSDYRYQAVFGRINYNINDKYLLNITGRRDGSSRFGPGKQFSNFGAVGVAWIFSQEQLLKDKSGPLSFGKLRGSVGVTGNDQIGNYQYLDAWGAYYASYDNSPALQPLNLFNDAYGWERNKKSEIALDLGFFKDRLLLSTGYYSNKIDNQLVAYSLPSQTGFQSIIRNLPAIIKNTGWEIQLTAQIINGGNLKWNSSFNISIPKNTLEAFPDLEKSSYASFYVVGKSLNSVYNYKSKGLDLATGLYNLEDLDGNNFLSPADFQINGNLDPKYFGGIRNSLIYKGIELDFFIDFKKQLGRNFLHSIYQQGKTAGTLFNQPVAILDRWQNSGDSNRFEKYNSTGNVNSFNVVNSSEMYNDASFLRLKTMSLSYSLPQNILSKFKAKNIRFYLEGQNLFTINKEKGYDPETQSIYRLPPLKIYTIGLQITY